MFEQGRIISLAVVTGNGELVPNGTVELEAFIERRDGLASVQARTLIALNSVDSMVFACQALSEGMLSTIFVDDLRYRV